MPGLVPGIDVFTSWMSDHQWRGEERANDFFIIFVDAIFTTSFERPFTESFDNPNANTPIP